MSSNLVSKARLHTVEYDDRRIGVAGYSRLYICWFHSSKR